MDEKPKSKALKAGFPFRKLWIFESKLEEEEGVSGSAVKSMSLCSAWTRAEALLEVWWGAEAFGWVEETDEGTDASKESDGLWRGAAAGDVDNGDGVILSALLHSGTSAAGLFNMVVMPE